MSAYDFSTPSKFRNGVSRVTAKLTTLRILDSKRGGTVTATVFTGQYLPFGKEPVSIKSMSSRPRTARAGAKAAEKRAAAPRGGLARRSSSALMCFEAAASEMAKGSASRPDILLTPGEFAKHPPPRGVAERMEDGIELRRASEQLG